MCPEKIPITIITGFLGSGKTTLINKIIGKERDKKFAVIENEFSDLPVDGELISGITKNRVFELANGCICCTLDSELQETLLQLIKMDLGFDHLLIETTGIAEPDVIVQNIIANDELKEYFFIQIKTMSFLLKGNFDIKKFSMWMDYFLHINQNSIIRVKGILSFEGISRKMIFQAIKSAYTLEEGNFWQNDKIKLNKIIFIGRNLDKKNISEGIESLIC